MRQQFIATNSIFEAIDECPWASHIAKVCGGHQCFESDSDYYVWEKQQSI